MSPERRADLDWTLGLWKGVRTRVVDGTAEPMAMRVERLPAGGGFQRFLEVGGDGATYSGAAVVQFDAADGLWHWRYMNRTSKSFSRYLAESMGPARSVWRSVSPKRARDSRLEERRVGVDGWRRSMFVSNDGGSTWIGLWVDELRKQ